MARLHGTGQFHKWFKFRISSSQLTAVRKEAEKRGVGVSEVIRVCIERGLDPSTKLQADATARQSTLSAIMDRVFDRLDAAEQMEFKDILFDSQNSMAEAEAEAFLRKKEAIITGAAELLGLDKTT